MTQPPWHMWGNSQIIELVSGGVVTTQRAGGQLVKIAYKRPENWTWLFAVKFLAGPASPGSVTVDFNLFVGLGRSFVDLSAPTIAHNPSTAFERFLFQWGSGTAPAGALKYSTSVNGPVRNDQDSAPFPQNVVNEIPAEDIQLSTTCILNTTQAGDTAQIEVHAYFTPKVHLRPDWFVDEFGGNEVGGR